MLTKDSYDTEPWLSKAFNYLSQFLSNSFFPTTFPKWLMKKYKEDFSDSVIYCS